jgi:tRNA nucleotidyltransferase (CCA-adding enzyme)
VGNPYNRFNEDALRIMRAVRFAAQLGFNIETTTYLAIESYVENLADISKERIQIELNKILLSDGIDYISTLVECGISKYCIPELDDMYGFNQHNPWHCYDVLTHSIKATNAIEPNVHLRLTMLLHDCGKPLSFELVDGRGRFYNHNIDSENIALMRMRELKYDNYTIGVVCRLIRYHDYRVEPKRSAVRKFLNKIGEEYFEMWCRVRVADIVSQNLKYSYDRLDKICKIKALYKEIQNDESAFRVKDLKISGRDIIDNNIATEGVEVGKILNKLLEAVMEEWVENEREQLLISAKLISKSV